MSEGWVYVVMLLIFAPVLGMLWETRKPIIIAAAVIGALVLAVKVSASPEFDACYKKLEYFNELTDRSYMHINDSTYYGEPTIKRDIRGDRVRHVQAARFPQMDTYRLMAQVQRQADKCMAIADKYGD